MHCDCVEFELHVENCDCIKKCVEMLIHSTVVIYHKHLSDLANHLISHK